MKFKATAVAAAVAAAIGVGWYATGDPPPQTAGPSHVPSIMAAASYDNASAPAQQQASSAAAKARAAPEPGQLHPLDAEFVRLSASADPADRARAYGLAYNCKEAASMLASTGVQEHSLSSVACRIAPGHWQDAALRKQLIAAVVERAEFGALVKLRAERTDAFKDDPQGYASLLARARVVGLEQAEPTALRAESFSLYQKAGFAAEDHDLAQAKALYRQSLTAAVAAEVNAERNYCAIKSSSSQCPNVALDLDKAWDASPLAVAQFSAAERNAIVQDGIKWANKRKDFST